MCALLHKLLGVVRVHFQYVFFLFMFCLFAVSLQLVPSCIFLSYECVERMLTSTCCFQISPQGGSSATRKMQMWTSINITYKQKYSIFKILNCDSNTATKITTVCICTQNELCNFPNINFELCTLISILQTLG